MGKKRDELEQKVAVLNTQIEIQERELIKLEERNIFLEERMASLLEQLDEAEAELLKPTVPLPNYRSMMSDAKQTISEWFRVY